MTDAEKLKILQVAFKNACKWIRENPPGDLDLYYNAEKNGKGDYLTALTRGNTDPDGRAWQTLFLRQAIKEINQEEFWNEVYYNDLIRKE